MSGAGAEEVGGVDGAAAAGLDVGEAAAAEGDGGGDEGRRRQAPGGEEEAN